jgi:GMP synthase-like glutamine amidotransferase
LKNAFRHAKVLIVNDLLRYESDLSDLAKTEWNGTSEGKTEFERKNFGNGVRQFAKNVIRLVQQPKTLNCSFVRKSQARRKVSTRTRIVMSGTLLISIIIIRGISRRSANLYQEPTEIPVLAICGAHQLVGMSFGANLKTLDDLAPSEKRSDRMVEYQYRFIKIIDDTDPIFEGVANKESGVWQDYTVQDDILRVWQNHGLQVEGVPEGFKMLATSYLCKNQMMVKRSDGQMIYAVQFHLEKSLKTGRKIRRAGSIRTNRATDAFYLRIF